MLHQVNAVNDFIQQHFATTQQPLSFAEIRDKHNLTSRQAEKILQRLNRAGRIVLEPSGNAIHLPHTAPTLDKVYHYIMNYFTNREYPPSVIEIQKAFRLSRKGTEDILSHLDRAGLIIWERRYQRGIHLMDVRYLSSEEEPLKLPAEELQIDEPLSVPLLLPMNPRPAPSMTLAGPFPQQEANPAPFVAVEVQQAMPEIEDRLGQIADFVSSRMKLTGSDPRQGDVFEHTCYQMIEAIAQLIDCGAVLYELGEEPVSDLVKRELQGIVNLVA